jgi:type I restriction enzyme S subunit
MKAEIRFSEIASLRKESVKPQDFKESKYIGLEHIGQGTLQLNGHGFGEQVDSQKQRFYAGDILFGKLRPYFRKVVSAPFDGICSTDIWVVKGVNSSDSSFIKYWMASDEFVDSSTGAAEGSRMPRAQWDWVSNFTCPITSIADRRKIGEFLELLDSKIRTNVRLGATFEEIAQTIFKSWFIDFDPVHAKARGEQPFGMDAETAALFPDSFDDSELGPIPAGWKVQNLGELASVIDCLHSKKPELSPHGEPYLQLDTISDSGVLLFGNAAKISQEDYRKWTSRIEVEANDLVITNVGRVGAVSIIPNNFKAAIGRNISAIRPHDGKLMGPWLITAFLNQTVRREISLNTDGGTVMDALNVRNIPKIRFTTAALQVHKEFTDMVGGIRTQMDLLYEQNLTLARLRDSLLPRLISGELEIPEELL